MNIDDLMAAVAEYHAGPPMFEEGDGSVTARELADRMGASVDVAQRIISQMLEDGRLLVGRRRIVKSDGNTQPVPAYKFRG